MLLEVAAEELEADASDLETDGKGNIHVKGAPAAVDPGVPGGARGAFQARPHRLRPRHVHGAALLSGAGDGPHAPLHLLRACLHRRRGRGRHGDRRGRRAVAEERLRDRPRAEPENGRAADRRRRLDGHEPRALRDDRALLSRPQPRAGRLQRISDARAPATCRSFRRRSWSGPPTTGRSAPRASAR